MTTKIFMGNSFVNGSVVEGQSCHEASARLSAAMHPSGAAAHPCAHAVVSLLLTSDVAPVHGRLFHSHTPSSLAAMAERIESLERQQVGQKVRAVA